MKSLRIRMLFIMSLFCLSALPAIVHAEDVYEAWTAKLKGSGSATDIKVDSSGNVYAIGCTYDSSGGNVLVTVKYDRDLNLLWEAKHYDENYLCYPQPQLAVDSNGNVVAVASAVAPDLYPLSFITVKYDSNGNQLWERKYSTLNNWLL